MTNQKHGSLNIPLHILQRMGGAKNQVMDFPIMAIGSLGQR
jgi:hypothetical protein